VSDKPRGTCPQCQRSIQLRRDGAIGFHRMQWVFSDEYTGLVWPQPPCAGWTKPPQQETP
jgi:hypothetical protein